MWEATNNEAWNHTAELMATILNSQGGEFTRADFHPALQKPVRRSSNPDDAL
jgi:hypothetical protein